MSLKSFLTRLIWICVLPLVALAAYLAINRVLALQTQRDLEAANLVRNFATALDRHIDARISALQMLAASSAAGDPHRLSEFYQEAQAFRKNFDSHIILADLSKHMIFNTRVPYGTALPNLPQVKGQSSASIAAATGKTAVSDMFLGPVSKTSLISMAVPVIDNGRPVLLLLSVIETSHFQQRLNELAIPPGWSMTVLDGKGEVIARRSPPGMERHSTGDKPPGRFVVKSILSPWSVVLEVPRGMYRAPILAAAIALVVAIFAATLISVLGGLLASRRLARSVAALAETPLLPTLSPTIAEIETVRRILVSSATDREEAESTLRKSEERLRFALETSHIGAWDLNLVDHKAFRSLEHDRIFGYPELLSNWTYELFLEHVLPEDRATVDSKFRRATETQSDWSFECRIRRADGQIRWIWAAGRHSQDADGAPNRMGGIVQDITERVEQQNSLRDSEAAFRAIFEQAAVGMARVGLAGRWLQVNHRLCDIVGYPQEELFTLTFQDITHPDDLNADLEYVRQVLTGDIDTYSMEKRYIRKDRCLIWINLTVGVVRTSDGEPAYFIAVVEDITERKLAEDEIRQLNAGLEGRVEERTAELLAANRELDAFAYAVSHDLRAPLRAMNGFSQALVEDYGKQLNGEALVYLEQITLASRHMGELIDGLLTLSRSTRGDLHRDLLDLSETAGRIRDELVRLEPDRPMAWQIEPGMLVRGDARLLEVVMRNLIGNAWKYTVGAPAPLIRIYMEERDGSRCYCVADNGAGFDMGHSQRLFKPFQRLHRQEEFPGIGIGLATVQRIVHRHGGEISAEGSPGKGAIFRFTFADSGVTFT